MYISRSLFAFANELGREGDVVYRTHEDIQINIEINDKKMKHLKKK